jgi:hypothetical protein
MESRLRNELDEVKERIRLLRLNPLPKIMRYGLALFSSDNLEQYVLYLEGLFNLRVCKNKEAAIKLFEQSLTSTESLNNELSRRTLLRLHELFSE